MPLQRRLRAAVAFIPRAAVLVRIFQAREVVVSRRPATDSPRFPGATDEIADSQRVRAEEAKY